MTEIHTAVTNAQQDVIVMIAAMVMIVQASALKARKLATHIKNVETLGLALKKMVAIQVAAIQKNSKANALKVGQSLRKRTKLMAVPHATAKAMHTSQKPKKALTSAL